MAATRTKTHSESSGSYSENITTLTPPISPHPIVVAEGIKLIPITQIYSQSATKKIKPILPAPLGSSDSESNPSNGIVDKAQILKARLIRNRESALQSRRKKKEYLQNLEVEVGDLRKEVRKLKDENCQLKAKLLVYSSCRCLSSISSKFSSSTKNASFMFALLIGFSLFNFIPMGNYLATTSDLKQSSMKFSSRHLLFVDDNNITSEESISSEFIPLYLNQTDLVRKANIENVLNWIPQTQHFNNNTMNFNGNSNNYANFEDPLQIKLTQMYEKSKLNQVRKERKKRQSSKKKVSKRVNDHDHNLYNPESFEFHEFFDEIKRKQDTFYVLSFRSDQQLILLPAIENFSQKFKMNLIMPRSGRSNDTTMSDKIMMMQIETIVLNTSLIEVAEKSIPSELVVKSANNSTASVMCNREKLNISSTEVNFNNVTKIREKIPSNFIAPKGSQFLSPYFELLKSRN